MVAMPTPSDTASAKLRDSGLCKVPCSLQTTMFANAPSSGSTVFPARSYVSPKSLYVVLIIFRRKEEKKKERKYPHGTPPKQYPPA